MTRERWQATQHPTGPQTQGKALVGGSIATLISISFELIILWLGDRLTVDYLIWYLSEHGDLIAGELAVVFGAVYSGVYWTTNRVKRKVQA